MGDSFDPEERGKAVAIYLPHRRLDLRSDSSVALGTFIFKRRLWVGRLLSCW